MVEKLKEIFEAVMDWLGFASGKLHEIEVDLEEFVDGVQEFVNEKVDGIQDVVGDTADKVQEEIGEAKSMLDKATDEEK